MSQTKWIQLWIIVLLTSIIITGYGGSCGTTGNDTTISGSSDGSGTFLIVTNPATKITQTSATLNGTVNPNGVITKVFFQWGRTGRTEKYGSTTDGHTIDASKNNVAVHVDLSRLSPNTEYNFRIVARRGGSTLYGANQTFTTLKQSPTCTTNPATNITYTSARLNGTVNPNCLSTSAYFNYGLTNSYTVTTNSKVIGSGTSNVEVSVDISGLSSNTEYNFRVFGTNSTGTSYGNNLTFTTGNSPGSPPTCITDAASDITYNSVKLNGTVIPNGVDTDAYFEYGISTNPYPISTTLQPIGNGITSVALSATVSSFTPNTLYNFRVVGTNGSITTTYGNNLTFTTAPPQPTCTTNSATNITATSATLNGTVKPNGFDVTSCYFDYGISVSYGSQQNVASLPGSGTSPISVTANVSSLSISTTYNFRVVATNAGGTTNGLNQTFTTSALAVDDYCWVANYGGGTGNTVTRIKKSDCTTTNITVETGPFGVAVDETYAWVTNYTSGTVIRIRKSDSTTTTIAVGYNPRGVAVDETYVWVAVSGIVTRIRKSNLSTTMITAGATSYGVAVDGTYCWVANTGSANVTRIRKSDSTTTTIAVGYTPQGITVDETYCWVANWNSDNVTRIRKSDLTTTAVVVGTQSYGIAVDETYCWVAIYTTSNAIRIRKSDSTTTAIAVRSTPQGVTVDETYCWVANYGSNNVTRIRKSDSTTTTIAVGTNPVSLGDMTGYAYDNYSRVP